MANLFDGRTTWVLGVALFAVGSVSAQTPTSVATPGASTPTVGGTPTIDLIVLKGTMPGVPLRYGSVISGSEVVEFQGQTLKKGTDYQMDYESGVVYLMRAQKAGQTMRVSYRYDSKASQAQVQTSSYKASLPTYRFDLAPGGRSSAIMGFGLAERQADGNVLMSNLYGYQHNAGGLKGLALVGERSKVDNQSGFEYRDKPAETETGRSKLILQNLSQNLSGGTVSLDYQEVSSNFTSFGAVGEAGYAQNVVEQLAKEKGLKRFGIAMDGVKVGDAKLSNGFKQVRDGNASIDWRSFGFENRGLKMDYSSRRVDSDFTKFDGLAEADRQQLKAEAGLTRNNFGASLVQKLGTFNFSTNEVEDANGEGIYRKSLDFKNSKWGVSLGEQKIDSGFSRFNSLFEVEKGQWGREAGVKRQWLSLNAAVLGGEAKPLFSHSRLSTPTGSYTSTDVSASNKAWSLEHSARKSSSNFDRMGAMADNEMDTNIKAIANMYGPNVATNPQMRQSFLSGVGIDRTYTKLAGSPFKNWNMSFDTKSIESGSENINVSSWTIAGKNFGFSLKNQSVTDKFSDFNRLLEFERQNLGVIAGLERSDLGLSLKPKPNATIDFQQTVAQTADGDMKRQSIKYSDRKLQVNVNTREVDPGFSNVNQLVDPERDLLNALKGFAEKDANLKWQLNSNLKIEASTLTMDSILTGEQSGVQSFGLNWNPDKKTAVDVYRYRRNDSDPLQVLFAQSVDRISVMRDFGRLGKFQFLNENIRFDGTRSTSPDSNKQYVSFETKVDKTTALRTEQTRTLFDNGDREDISANTLSTEINKKAGVSVTDVHVNRNGDDKDERRRNYGFWYDFGKGMKLSYGYVRQENGENGTLNSNVNLTAGTLDFLQVNNASYAENRWDGQRSQGLANVSFGSAKGLNLGPMKDLKFHFSHDTATDQTHWVKENRSGGISAKVGSNTMSMDYRSQMHASGLRGIDRAFTFQTDQSDKRWFKGFINYNARHLPNDELVMMRNIGFTLKPMNGMELTHNLVTNPEDPNPRPDLPMFKINNPWRVNKWNLKVDTTKTTALSASWEEKINDTNFENSRLSGLTLDLFRNSGSPLQLFYGVEERWGNVDRMVAQRYWLKFDQRPGANQVLSIYAGNVAYRASVPGGFRKDNWTLNANYQLKF